MIKRRRNKLDSIIHGRKFIGTLITDNYNIEDIEVYVYARHSDDIKVRIKVAASHPEYESYKKLLMSCYLNEMHNMAVKFSLQCSAKNGDELVANSIRFRRSDIVTNKRQDNYVNAKFHVKGAVLTRYGEHASMVKFGVFGSMGTLGEKIETEIGDILIKEDLLIGKKIIGSLTIVPPKENHYDNWHENAHKLLQDIVLIIGFLMGKLITITFEEHCYPDRSELHFREKIEARRPEEFLITTGWDLNFLVNLVVSSSKKDRRFIEVIGALAAAVTMANTYSPYWRVRLLAIMCALDTWGEKFFPNKPFREKLEEFCKTYKHINISSSIVDLNKIRRKIVHKGGVTEEKAKYFFFMCHHILVDILFAELQFRGGYFSYFVKGHVGKRTELTYPQC